MMDVVADLVAKEEARQREMIGLIPSENLSSPGVQSVLGSCLSSKYSEGYPGRRYYEGNQIVDELETLAVESVKALFGVPYANVQPYSGSPANSAILFALLEPGDTLAGLSLGSGGHLTHGHPKVTFSGRYFNSIHFGLDADARIDFAGPSRLVTEHRPKLVIAGTTSYPYTLDFGRLRTIARGALRRDHDHYAQDASRSAWCGDSCHRTRAGPGAETRQSHRCRVIPGLQGGPHNATTAAIAVAADEAARPEFVRYTRQVTRNAAALATALSDRGLALVGGGTENHLMVLDLSALAPGLGTQAAIAMDAAGLYADRNVIPNEPTSPFYPSGARIGTPLVTTRGMKEPEMTKIAEWVERAIRVVESDRLPEDRRERSSFVQALRRRLPALFLVGRRAAVHCDDTEAGARYASHARADSGGRHQSRRSRIGLRAARFGGSRIARPPEGLHPRSRRPVRVRTIRSTRSP